MSSVLDVYDHEVLALTRLAAELTARAKAKKHNYTAFEREIRDRFADLGFTVDVNWYEFSLDGAPQEGALPQVTITGRAPGSAPWDPDRQVHEAVHNVLGLPGEEGWIKADPDTYRRFMDGNGGHGHGHQH
jgi:hypothetical protein